MTRFVLLSSFIIAGLPLAATAQQPAPVHSAQGAVRVVDVRGRALEVTTGIGFALRVVRLQVPANVPVSLGQLRPGDIVRVTYGARPRGNVLYTIERLGRMETGLERTP